MIRDAIHDEQKSQAPYEDTLQKITKNAKASHLYYFTLTLHSSVGLAFKTHRAKKAIYERETRALTASPSTLFRKTSPTRKTT